MLIHDECLLAIAVLCAASVWNCPTSAFSLRARRSSDYGPIATTWYERDLHRQESQVRMAVYSPVRAARAGYAHPEHVRHFPNDC